jgi:hypothetical protein
MTATLTWSDDVHMALGLSRLSGCAPMGCAGSNAYLHYVGSTNSGYSRGRISFTYQVNASEIPYLYVHNADFDKQSSWRLVVSVR